MRLTAEQRGELLAALRLRRALTDKALCARFGISRKTLWRLRIDELNAPMSPNAAHERPSVWPDWLRP